MGCRPSKQATSKVRAVEHKEDFRCSCSPRKIRKHHKCASGSNISRRISACSGRGGSKQSLSSSHRPRSSKSADVDFPEFSTTTAVYRTSASRTSKITLRLSCDGSTLEIEQCDYDLEKVRGDGESKPRPWNSAPNLTKMRDIKSRLFRDSYLPIKHSKSGWSPSFLSPTFSNRGGFFHAPVQVSTPDDSLCSSGNISGYSFSVFSQSGSSYRDKNIMYQAFESTTFAGKTFGKTSLNKSNTSSKCSSGDERRPLLLDILKESHKKASLEGNINKAASAASMENTCKDRTQTCSSLDNMINDLETSLAVANRRTSSSVPHTARPCSLKTIHVDSIDIHQPDVSLCPGYLEQPPATFRACPSPDIEHIPVSVISSYITCQGRPVTCVGCDRHFCPLIPSPDVYFSGDQKQDNNTRMTFDPPSVTSLAENHSQATQPPCLTNSYPAAPLHPPCLTNNYPAAPLHPPCLTNSYPAAPLHPPCLTNSYLAAPTQLTCKDIFKKDISTHVLSDGGTWSTPHPSLPNAPDRISDVNQIPLHLAPSIDPNSVIHFDKQDCSAGNKNPGFCLSTANRLSRSLETNEQGTSGLSDRGQVFELCSFRPGLDLSNQTTQKSVANCLEDFMYRNNHRTFQFQVQHALNNLNQDGAGKAEPRSINLGELSYTTFSSHSPHGAQADSFPGAQKCCSDALCAQTTGTEFCENESRIRQAENFPSSLGVNDGVVGDNYIILQQTKQGGDKRPSADERSTVSRFVVPESIHCKQQESQQEDDKTMRANLELHSLKNRQTKESGVSKQDKVCHDCRPERSDVSRNSNLNLIRKSRQPGSFSHQLNGNTSLLDEINACPWEALQTLNLVQANDTNSSFSNISLELGRETSDRMKHSNTTDRHQTDDAGYLLGLLFPEGANFIKPLNSNTRFSFDFEYVDESETTCSSDSDSSDNEISPLCYSLLGQQSSCEKYPQNLNSQLRDIESFSTDPTMTSMQNVREIIVYQRLAMIDPCVTAIEDRPANLCRRPRLRSEGNYYNSGVYSKDSESCFIEFPQHAYTNDISLSEPCPLLAKIENPLTRTSNVIHGNALDNRRGNDLGNKQEIMVLDDDIIAPNFSARINAAGRDSPKHHDTDSEVCENLSLTKLCCLDTVTNSFHSLLPFSETSEGTGESLLGFSSQSDVIRNQRREVGPTSGQVLIQQLTSGPCHYRNNSGRRYPGRIISGEDEDLVDTTSTSFVNYLGHGMADNERALEKLQSMKQVDRIIKQTTSDEKEDTNISRDNETCNTDGGFTSLESYGYKSSHELEAINSSIRAHLCDVGMGKNAPAVVDKPTLLDNGMQFLLSNCQKQIDRLNNNSNIVDEHTSSQSSLCHTTLTTASECPPEAVTVNSPDNPEAATPVDKDINVSENNKGVCIEKTALNHETMPSQRSSSRCYLQKQEDLNCQQTKPVVSCSETAAVQQISSIKSEIPACQCVITNTEVQANCPSESITCSLGVASSTKTINGKQSFHKHYHLLDRLNPGKSTGSNATLELRPSAELGNNVCVSSLPTSNSRKLSDSSIKIGCLKTGSGQDGLCQNSNPTKYPLILGNPSVLPESVSDRIIDIVSHEKTEESLQMPRNNVLSLVRYFEKVPYIRRETKQ